MWADGWQLGCRVHAFDLGRRVNGFWAQCESEAVYGWKNSSAG